MNKFLDNKSNNGNKSSNSSNSSNGERERKVVKIIEENDEIFYGYKHKIDLVVMDAYGYSGFLLDKPKQTIFDDGSVEMEMPIFNSLSTTLEIQVLDESGKIIDRQYADPKQLITNMVDGYSEMFRDVFDSDRKGMKTAAVSKETQVKIHVPLGGKVKFTYESENAKLANFIDPIADIIGYVLDDYAFSAFEQSNVFKNMSRDNQIMLSKIFLQYLGKSGALNMIKSSMKSLSKGNFADADLKKPYATLYDATKNFVTDVFNDVFKLGNMTETSVNVAGNIIFHQDTKPFLKQIFGSTVNSNAALRMANRVGQDFTVVGQVKKFTERSLTALNFIDAILNQNQDFSKYNIELTNERK